MTHPSEYLRDYLKEELERIGLRAIMRIIASIYREKAYQYEIKADILQFELNKKNDEPCDTSRESLKYTEA
jgi:hypothetical protein